MNSIQKYFNLVLEYRQTWPWISDIPHSNLHFLRSGTIDFTAAPGSSVARD